jgi:catechol 2,3-dioxygenase
LSATGTSQGSTVQIHPHTSIGTVRLTVADLERSREFYERAIGLRASEQDDGTLALSAAGKAPFVELRGDSSAPALDRRAPGLFHLAILVPGRRDLAHTLARMADAGWPLDGASDHLVSEALYLSDPDGNGIEIYRDRPRDQWRRVDGQLAMGTLPLDVDSVLGELSGAPEREELPAAPERQELAPPGTRIGHVHLQVSDLGAAERFYSGLLGFDVTVRGYPGALFVSAGGYHHHIGLNTWHSLDAPSPAPGSIGLRNFEIRLPNADELDRILQRVGTAGIEIRREGAGSLIRDPSGNGVLLRER